MADPRVEGATTIDAVCMFAKALHEMLEVRGYTVSQLLDMSPTAFNEFQDIFSATEFEGMAGVFKYPAEPVDANGRRGPDPEGAVEIEQNQHLDQYPDNMSGIREMLGGFVSPNPITWTGSPLFFPAYDETVTVDGEGSLVGTPIQTFKTCPSGEALIFTTNECEGCPPGSEYSNKLCAPCKPGNRGTEGQAGCEKCLPGTYQPEEGQLTCLDADPGYFVEFRESVAQAACVPGTAQGLAGSTVCEDCDFGTFSLAAAALSCLNCSALETTLKVRRTDNTSCVCADGAFRSQDNNDDCVVCGDGLDCIAGQPPRINPGYNSLPIDGILLANGDSSYKIKDIYFCAESEPCPGGEPGTCAFGHDSTSISCGRCEKGFYHEKGMCTACTGISYLPIMGFFAIFLIFCLSVVLALTRAGVKISHNTILAGATVACFAFAIQSYSVLASFDLNWGEPFETILFYMSLMTFNLDVLHFRCDRDGRRI
jgi:hypothetical protein